VLPAALDAQIAIIGSASIDVLVFAGEIAGAHHDLASLAAQRLAALRQARTAFERTIKKYGQGASAGASPTTGGQPQRLRFNPTTGELE